MVWDSKSSRDKGKRGEYLVRDILRNLGYTANRVPLSGASQGFKGDIFAEKGLDKYTFEVKLRKAEFDRIYVIYHNYRQEHGVFRFFSEGRGLISMGYDFLKVKQPGEHFVKMVPQTIVKGESNKINFATLNKIYNLKDRWMQGCDFLVIKQNGLNPLFIKYW